MTDRLIRVLEGEFSIHRLNSRSEIPSSLTSASYCWIARTADELSVVCDTDIPVDADLTDVGWSGLQVVGPLDFGETGILNDITSILADAGISIVALSTFDTDYFLVKTDRLVESNKALRDAGWDVIGQV